MKKKLTSDLLSSLFRQLSMLIRAGAQPEAAVELLQQEGAELDGLLHALQRQHSFADACAEWGRLPSYAVKLIALGETTGRLEECLDALAHYYEQQSRLENQLQAALVRPALLLLLMCVVLAVLVFAVIPVFLGVYESLSGSLTASSYAYVSAAAWISRICLILTALCCALALLLSVSLRVPGLSRRTRSLLETLPGVGSAVYQLSLARLAGALSSLLSSGMEPSAALDTAIRLNEHRGLGQKLAVCQTELSAGAGLAQCLTQQGLFSPLRSWVLSSGAASGNLAETLADLALQSEHEGQAKLLHTIDAVEPLFTIFLTISVGLSLLSALLPLVGILGAIG